MWIVLTSKVKKEEHYSGGWELESAEPSRPSQPNSSFFPIEMLSDVADLFFKLLIAE